MCDGVCNKVEADLYVRPRKKGLITTRVERFASSDGFLTIITCAEYARVFLLQEENFSWMG
jgi:hypothetical protein